MVTPGAFPVDRHKRAKLRPGAIAFALLLTQAALRGLLLTCFPLARAITLATKFHKALIIRAAGPDYFVDTRESVRVGYVAAPLSHDLLPDAGPVRVVQPPSNVSLRAGKRVGRIGRHAVGIIPQHLPQPILLADRKTIESLEVAFAQPGPVFLTCGDFPEPALCRRCPPARASTRLRRFRPPGRRPRKRCPPAQLGLAPPRITRSAGTVRVPPRHRRLTRKIACLSG
jgi:hypothetical protein